VRLTVLEAVGIQPHLMHMRWLVYKHAVVKAVREAHTEMRDYSKALADLVARTRSGA
jgi:hypothetical protein